MILFLFATESYREQVEHKNAITEKRIYEIATDLARDHPNADIPMIEVGLSYALKKVPTHIDAILTHTKELTKERPNANIQQVLLELCYVFESLREQDVERIIAHTKELIKGRLDVNIYEVIDKLWYAFVKAPAYFERIVTYTKDLIKDRSDVDIIQIFEAFLYILEKLPTHFDKIVVHVKELINGRQNIDVLKVIKALYYTFEKFPNHSDAIVSYTKTFIKGRSDVDVTRIIGALYYAFERLQEEDVERIVIYTKRLIQGKPNLVDIGKIVKTLSIAFQDARMRNEVDGVINRVLIQIQRHRDITDEDIVNMILEVGIEVHQVASKDMELLWKKFQKEVSRDQLLDYKDILPFIWIWIDELKEEDRVLFSEELSLDVIKTRLKALLENEQFINALQTRWANLGADITGATLLRYALTYIQIHPDLKNAFLVQGLWQSITAGYDSLPEGVDPYSCIQGIAERFLLWARDILEIDFKSLISQDKVLNSFFATTDIQPNEGEKEFIDRKLEELKSLKESVRNKLLAQYPDKNQAIEEAFNNGEIQYLFDPATTFLHFKEAYQKQQSKESPTQREVRKLS